jgi:hypothetical protein
LHGGKIIKINEETISAATTMQAAAWFRIDSLAIVCGLAAPLIMALSVMCIYIVDQPQVKH